jgi:hypothetical protein
VVKLDFQKRKFPLVIPGLILKRSFVPKGRRAGIAQATLKMKNGIDEDNDFRRISYKKNL